MIRIILCEGETDAILISYYLSKMAGWNYVKKPKLFELKFSEQDNKCCASYRNQHGDELLICGVGGKDNFKNFFEEYIKNIIWLSPKEQYEFKIALITDRDNASINELEEHIKEQLSPVITNVKDNSWTVNKFKNSFGTNATIDFLLISIPRNESGALESLLMNSLSENTYDKNIVNISKEFIEEIAPNADKYISTERLKLKSQLGVVFSILNPEKIFYLFDERLNSVKWETSQTLNDCFKKLLEI